MKQRTLFATIILLLSGQFALAQTGRNTQNSLLPEIDPQDIEIRSEFKARFPGLRRQPILGFNPKPRVFRIDPNRMPFMETPEQAVAGISMTQLDRPEPPSRNILPKPSRINGLVRAALGSYLSPEIEAYGFQRLNDQSIFSGNLNYQSSTGHLDTQDSDFRFMDISGLYGTRLNNGLKASVRASLFSDYNHLFELSPSIPNDNSGTAEKSYSGINAGVILQNHKNALEGWELFLNASLVGIDQDSPNAALDGGLNHQSLITGFEKKWAGNELHETFAIGANLKAGNYSIDNGGGSTQWLNGDVFLNYHRLLNYRTELDLKAGLAYLNDGLNGRIRFTTDLGFIHTVNDRVRVSGSLFAEPELKDIWEHHQANRFLGMGSLLQQEYRTGIKSGIEVSPLDPLNIFANVSYTYIDNLAYYNRTSQLFGLDQELTYYDVYYSNANRIYFDIGITQHIVTDAFWLDASIYAQRPRLSDNTDIPFEEKIGFNGAVNIRPMNELTIRSWLQYVGEREAPATAETLGSFTLLNAEADYEINDRFGLYIKVLNILNQEYQVWEGYQERPFQLFGGIKLKF